MKSFCVFGDSVAKGVVYDTVRSKYVSAKEGCSELFERITGSSVRNLSRFGCTILRGGSLLNRYVSELASYDMVLLEFGGNDCDFSWSEIAAEPQKENLPNVPIKEFKTEYERVIDEVRSSGGRPAMLTLPPLHAERFFNWVSRGLDKDAILSWLGDVHHIYRWQELYNLAVCDIANRKDVPIIDIRQAFLEKNDYGEYICEDGMHPNEKGQRLMADTLLSYWEGGTMAV